MSLFQMSFSGAVMICMVIAARRIFLHRLSKKILMLLWMLALVRLMIPFYVPAQHNVYSFLEEKLAANMTQMSENNVYREAQSQVKANMTQVSYFDAEIENDIAVEQGKFSIIDGFKDVFDDVSIMGVITIVWALGAAVLALYFSAAYIIGRRRFAQAVPLEGELLCLADEFLEDNRIIRNISVCQSDLISSPLTYGIFAPVILIPKSMDANDKKILRLVLAHEFEHIRRFDALRKLFMAAALCIHWFNPFVWVMYSLFNRDIELCCDEMVLAGMGEGGGREYALMLISLEEQRNKIMPFYSGFSRNEIQERIEVIMNKKKSSIFTGMAVLAAVAAAGLALSACGRSESAVVQNQESVNQAVLEQTTDSLISNDRVNSAVELSEKELSKSGELSEGVRVEGSELSEEELLEEYEKFGVEKEDGYLYFNGERLRYFLDGYDNDGCVQSRYIYYDAEGTIDAHTVRNDTQNADGSTTLFGPIADIQSYPQEDFDKRTERYEYLQTNLPKEAFTYEISADDGIAVADLAEEPAEGEQYYIITRDENTLTGESAEKAKAEDQSVAEEAVSEYQTAVAEGNSIFADGKTLEEKFKEYEEYGISYEKTPEGQGNVYLNDRLVKKFVDESDSGAFSFTSYDADEKDGISMVRLSGDSIHIMF